MTPQPLPPSDDPPDAPLIAVRGLRVAFGRADAVPAVQDVSFDLHRGRCLAIVGESGSGKSVTARSLIGLAGRGAHVTAERLTIGGRDVRGQPERAWRALRGKTVGYVLQDALVSLDPLRSVGSEVTEGLWVHGAVRRSERRARAAELLRRVGVPDPEIKARQLPFELSGGQRQRALIAAALALDPDILIADEPTTALDVTVQAQVLALLEDIRTRGKTLVLISHDLAVVSRMADDVLIMRHGLVVEHGPAAEVFRSPRHPYTRALIDAVPSAHSRGSRLAPASAPRLKPETVHAAPRAAAPHPPSAPLLEATGLVKSFRRPDGSVSTVVRDVSFSVARGEALGIVGESGSGKSTVARLVLALERPDAGTVRLEGTDWSGLTEAERRPRRRAVSMVYQDPLSHFDPRWTVARLIEDALPADGPADARRARVSELLDLVGLPEAFRARLPLELSGGQRQRVAIARALAPGAKLIVCDEPVSALDVSIQAQVLDLLADLRDQLGVGYLFISHDLGVVHHLCDRVLVMQAGRALEQGSADDIFLRPEHPYTRALVAAVPRLSTGIAA